jgi:hypothetical protein
MQSLKKHIDAIPRYRLRIIEGSKCRQRQSTIWPVGEWQCHIMAFAARQIKAASEHAPTLDSACRAEQSSGVIVGPAI